MSSPTVPPARGRRALVVTVNGEELPVDEGATLLTLVRGLGREPAMVAIEHNGTIVPRARYGETALTAGDRVEIVQFVQGG